MLRYRYLFSQLVRRELRQKYKGSALGVLWYFVNPLVLMALYGLMLRSVLRAVAYPDYPIFILAGLVVWLFFSQSLLSAASSLVDQSSLVSKVRFPRETVPAAIVTVQLVPLIAMLVVLLPLFFVSGVLFQFQGLPGVQSHPWIGSLLRWGDPVAPFIAAMRAVVYSGAVPPATTLAYVLAAAALALGAGILLFRRFSRELAVVL